MGRVLPWFAPDRNTEPEFDPYVLHAVTSGNGPPAVLIHGVAGSNMVWGSMVPLLEPHFSVIRVDLLGYGHSPKPAVAHTCYRHVAAIRRTLAQRGFAPPYVLIGLSMGSNLMLEYALRWPDEVRDMVGIGFPYYPSEAAARVGLRNNPWTNIALRHPVLAGVLVPSLWGMGRLAPGVLSRSASIYTGPMAKDALRARYKSFRSSLLNCMVHYRLDEPLKASGQARRLFIHGGADQWAPPEAVREAIGPFPLSALRVIDDAPHNLAVAEPGRTAKLILDHVGMGERQQQ
jgi:pimeloyl-ACP methyl ester carboxylesterase